jgi:bisphosphoglycerate-independent phosphoglycerate mutase (AlkP superfamily)
MDPEVVPGIILTNRKIKAKSPALHDLTPTILKIFGVEIPKKIKGKPIF